MPILWISKDAYEYEYRNDALLPTYNYSAHVTDTGALKWAFVIKNRDKTTIHHKVGFSSCEKAMEAAEKELENRIRNSQIQ